MINLNKLRVFSVIAIFSLAFAGFPALPASAITITDLETDIEGTNVFVTWRTDTAASGCVQFGTTIDYDFQLCSITGFNTLHDLFVTNLLPETFYHYRVVSKDSGGKEVRTSDGTFKTGEQSDTTRPEIDNLNIEFVGSTVTMITWNTNEETRGTVNYGLGSGNLDRSVRTRGDEFDHEVIINRLLPGATYYYQVKAEDDDENVTYSSIQSFRMATNKRVEEEPLNVNLIKPISPTDGTITETTATLSWRNSRPAKGQVSYGTDPERLNKRVTVDDTRTFQTVELTGLRPGTRYYYRISQTDLLRKSTAAPNEDGTFSFVTKARVEVLGVSTSVIGETPEVQRTGQPAVLTSLKQPEKKVLGAFTNIYTPASELRKTMHSPNVYAVLKEQKHWIRNEEIFKTYGYNFGDVKIVSKKEIDEMPDAVLVKSPDHSSVYYVYPEQGVKINIPNPEVFNSYPANKWENIVTLAKNDLDLFPVARLITVKTSPTVYLLENNSRRPFVSEEAMVRFGFNNKQVVIINKTHLNTIPEGERIE